MAHEFTAENFQTEVLDSDQAVLVDFWAPWCAPCRQLTPIVEELAEENTDAKVGKLDIAEFEDIAKTYGVTKIPAIFVFKGGEVVQQEFGVLSKKKMQSMIDDNKA